MGRSGKGCGGRTRGGGGTKQSCARDRGERVLPRPASRRAADRRGRRPRPTRTRGGGAARDLGRSAQPRGCRRAPTGDCRTMATVGERLSVFALAAIVLAAIVALSFGAGWLVGKLLL